MPREGITLGQVEEAIEALVAAGHPTSYRRIRAQLGEGSLTTIANHVKTLAQHRQADPTVDGQRVPLTDAVQQALVSGAESTWAQLLAAAEDIIAEAHVAADEKIETAQTAAVQSEEARDQAEARNVQLAEALAALQTERDALQHRIESLTDAQRALESELVGAQTRTEGLNELVAALKRTLEQQTIDIKNADRRTERVQGQVATAAQAHEDAIATLRAEGAAERDAIAQQRDDEGRRADSLQQRVAALDTDFAKLSAQRTAERDAHDATRAALQQAEHDLDARREECHTRATAVAQRDEQLAAAEATRQQEKNHFAALIAEKDRRVAEQAASIRDVTAALKRAQSAQKKSS
ncbi:MAG: DNA-binding protein [Pseudomonadales bacterium]